MSPPARYATTKDRENNTTSTMATPAPPNKRPPDATWIYKTVGGKPLEMKVFLPPGYPDNDGASGGRRSKPESYPTFVIFHGGSWREGLVAWHYADCRHWSTTRACIAISVDYRLRNEDNPNLKVPLICVRDAKSAIRFLRANADKLNVDPKKIVCMGDSAGGQMAAATAIIDSADSNHQDDDLTISCIPDAVILTNPFFRTQEEMPGARVFCPEELCPSRHLRSNLPPIITFVGTNDRIVPHGSMIDFHNSLEEKGNVSALYVGSRGKHGFCNGSNLRNKWFYWSVELEDKFLVDNKILSADPHGRYQIERPEGVEQVSAEDYEAFRSGPKPTNKFGHTIVSSEEPKPGRRSRFRALRDSLKSKAQEVASGVEDSLKDYASGVASDLRQSAVGDTALDVISDVAGELGKKNPNSRLGKVMQGVQSILVDGDDGLVPARRRDYTHSYWFNGWRRLGGEATTPDILCLESGHYGLTIDAAKLTSARFAALEDDGLSFVDVISSRSRMDNLSDNEMIIEVIVDNEIYRAQTAKPVNDQRPKICNGRLWEGARIVQHYELVGIVLKGTQGDGNGERESSLNCKASLYFVTWPEEFAITLSLSPPENTTWRNGALVRIEFGDWSVQQPFAGPWAAPKSEEVSLACNVVSTSSKLQDTVQMTVSNKDKAAGSPPQTFAVAFDTHFSCFKVDINRPKRSFASGYTDIRDHDVFGVDVENESQESTYVPVLFHLFPAANITGLVPLIYVQEDGKNDDSPFVPSGIPIQNSKNWHYPAMGSYVRAFSLLPVKPGANRFEFRVYYAFFGDTLCSASHGNLSLVGWPKYSEFSTAGRWDQLAIGCFGETFCIDSEMGATTQTITDVRALMVRAGKDGKMWSWTNAGWGGDWLCVYNNKGKLYVTGMKTAYISQGPCITHVNFNGYYGINKEVSFDTTVHTTRANDYARTIQKIHYSLNSNVAFTNNPNAGCCLFRVGGPAGWEGWVAQKVAIGNADGLIEEVDVPESLQVNDMFVDRLLLTGPGPWWVGFPKSGFVKPDSKGIAWKGIIIRKYASNVADQVTESPSISLFLRQKQPNGQGSYVDALVMPPEGVQELNQGDTFDLDIEWVTFPYSSDDYYGSNETFRTHLQENPASWKTIHREAVGNNLSVDIKGGEVVDRYPLIIRATGSPIDFTIHGGVGAVPIRFESLESKDFKLYDESGAPSNELYDLGYETKTSTYSLAFNLLLDDKPISSWTLK